MRTRSLIASVATVAAAISLASCGSDEGPATAPATTPVTVTDTGTTAPSEAGTEPSPAADRRRVKAAIEAVLVDPDSRYVCTQVLTAKALRTAFGERQGCLRGRPRPTLADSLKAVCKLEVEGDRARAVVVPEGGLYDGVAVEIAAVRDGERWRIDRFRADVPVGP